jgi:hypothetical protein
MFYITHMERIFSDKNERTSATFRSSVIFTSLLFKNILNEIQGKVYRNSSLIWRIKIEWGSFIIECWWNWCKSYEATGDQWICIMRRFVICVDHEIVFGWSNQEGFKGRSVLKVWERGETVQELVWRPEVNRSLGRSMCKCKGKYEIDP